jgi:hypothetical protein
VSAPSRVRLDDLTSDQLDALYAERDQLAAAVDLLQTLCTVPSPDPGGATARAVAYSAGWVEALDRVQTMLDRLYVAGYRPADTALPAPATEETR